MTRFLLTALPLVGCGQVGDLAGESVRLAYLVRITPSDPAAPPCDVLFAAGSTLPSPMPVRCVRARGDLVFPGVIVCADGRLLYQLDVTDGPAYGFTGGTVRVVRGADPAYRSAYAACRPMVSS